MVENKSTDVTLMKALQTRPLMSNEIPELRQCSVRVLNDDMRPVVWDASRARVSVCVTQLILRTVCSTCRDSLALIDSAVTPLRHIAPRRLSSLPLLFHFRHFQSVIQNCC